MSSKPTVTPSSLEYPVLNITGSSVCGVRDERALHRLLGLTTDVALKRGITDGMRVVDNSSTLYRVVRFELRGRQPFLGWLTKPRELAAFELKSIGPVSLAEVKTLTIKALAANDGVDDLDAEPELLDEVKNATSVRELTELLRFDL